MSLWLSQDHRECLKKCFVLWGTLKWCQLFMWNFFGFNSNKMCFKGLQKVVSKFHIKNNHWKEVQIFQNWEYSLNPSTVQCHLVHDYIHYVYIEYVYTLNAVPKSHADKSKVRTITLSLNIRDHGRNPFFLVPHKVSCIPISPKIL